MPMSNLLGIGRLSPPAMAAKRPPFGISHLTVIPSNFEPEPCEEPCDEEDTDDEYTVGQNV